MVCGHHVQQIDTLIYVCSKGLSGFALFFKKGETGTVRMPTDHCQKVSLALFSGASRGGDSERVVRVSVFSFSIRYYTDHCQNVSLALFSGASRGGDSERVVRVSVFSFSIRYYSSGSEGVRGTNTPFVLVNFRSPEVVDDYIGYRNKRWLLNKRFFFLKAPTLFSADGGSRRRERIESVLFCKIKNPCCDIRRIEIEHLNSSCLWFGYVSNAVYVYSTHLGRPLIVTARVSRHL